MRYKDKEMLEQPIIRETMVQTGSDSVESPYDDWELVRQCQENRKRYFPVLVERHYALVVNIGYRFFLDRELAEDMAQEVFLKVFNKFNGLKEGKQPFVHWLCRITTNQCRSMYRKRTSEKNTVTSGKVDYWFGDESVSAADELVDDEKKISIRMVNEALKELKADERMVMILCHFAEMKTREIASAMKAHEYTVRRLLRRAEEKMRKIVAQRTLEHYA